MQIAILRESSQIIKRTKGLNKGPMLKAVEFPDTGQMTPVDVRRYNEPIGRFRGHGLGWRERIPSFLLQTSWGQKDGVVCPATLMLIVFELVTGCRVLPDTSLQSTVLAPRASVGQLTSVFVKAVKSAA
eukprot:5121086-Alexandrium_andersonii.AAC.1